MTYLNEPQFHNRTRERQVLDAALASRRSELLIVYGRRGVGKSALLRQALTDAGYPYMYHRAVRRTLPLQLATLTEDFRAAFPSVFLPQPFQSTTAFLDGLTYEAEERQRRGDLNPVCAVIDELPYLAEVDKGFLTQLQHWWDDNKRRPNLKIFLAGSYVAFMEKQVLDINAPLYNRRTGALHLAAMDYAEAALFFPNYDPEERMTVYAILGGMPSYLEQFDPTSTIKENVTTTILRRNTYLSEEPDWLLLEDLRRDVIYGSILRAVAQGSRKPSDIARAIGKDSAQDITSQLTSLQELGLVVREVPITDRLRPQSRTSLYFLADNYLDFWYRYVDPAKSLIGQGLGQTVWDRAVAPALHEYVSRPAFERACRQYLWRALAAEALPPDLHISEIGTWWGAKDVEIDVVALNEHGKLTAVGSCKWTNEPMDVREYAALLADLNRAGLVIDTGTEMPHIFLFSRSGFTSRLNEMATGQDPPHLSLITLPQMYAV